MAESHRTAPSWDGCLLLGLALHDRGEALLAASELSPSELCELFGEAAERDKPLIAYARGVIQNQKRKAERAGHERQYDVDTMPVEGDPWLRERTARLFVSLSPVEQQLFDLLINQGLSHAEISERLEIPLRTLRRRIASLKIRLQALRS